ncbi:MAG: hypothetical protein F6J89_20395 [Symploca sp. SIO1C4]|uniref:Uncharacterized protein n=1 Tax=Symploca sp. SIO1C4 TaxID=2607765 RepID=A0A6B3N9Z9_9CYAN|nr:hypothetical protein [Symploca sp. SIO1C4]
MGRQEMGRWGDGEMGRFLYTDSSYPILLPPPTLPDSSSISPTPLNLSTSM